MGFGIGGIWLFQIPKPNTKTQIPNDLRSYAGSESFPITAVFLSISHTLGLGNWVVISGICLLTAVLGSNVQFPKSTSQKPDPNPAATSTHTDRIGSGRPECFKFDRTQKQMSQLTSRLVQGSFCSTKDQ